MSRNRAIVLLGEHDLEELLDLPDGYEVRYIGADSRCSAVIVVVTSDELRPVPEGVEAPLLHGAFSREQIVVDGKVYSRWTWSPTVDDE